MTEHDETEIRWIFSVIQRRFWLIVGLTLIITILTFGISRLIKPVYESTVTLLVELTQSSIADEYSALIAGERLALTYSEMLEGVPVLTTVINKLNLGDTPDELAKKITVEQIQNTQLIRIHVKHESPEQAALIANTLAEAFTDHIRTILTTRYTVSLSNLQKKIEALTTTITENQSELNTLRAGKNEKDAQIAVLENLLSEYRTDYRTLERNSQDLQLTLAQMTDHIKIVEAANVPDSTIYAPYIASLKLLVDQNPASATNVYSSETYAQMLVSQPVIEEAIKKLDLNEKPDSIANRMEIKIIPGTQILQLDVRDSSRTKATLIANTIAEIFLSQVQVLVEKPFKDRLDSLQVEMDRLSNTIDKSQNDYETLILEQARIESDLTRLEGELSENRNDLRTLQQDYEQLLLDSADEAEAVVISEPAQVPIKPVSPRPFINMFIAALVGGMVAVGIAFILETFDDTKKIPEILSQKYDLSTLGTIGLLKNGEAGLVVESSPRSPSAEAFRALAANIRYAGLDKPIKTLLVTSPHPMDGKSLVASNLGVAFSQSENSVIVVDADLRLPMIHKLFGVEQEMGLTESLLKNSLDGNLRTIRPEHLSVLTSGTILPNPTEVIGSQRMKNILVQLSKKADIVVIDSSPLLLAADAKTLATEVDGVLLIIRSGKTTTQAASEAVESLRQVKANIIGVVLNGEPNKKDGYYYRYHDEQDPSESRWKKWKKGIVAKAPWSAKYK